MSFPDHGRVLFTATLVRGHIAKFHIPYLRWFKERGWETWVAAKNDYPDRICEIPYCDHFVNIDFARSPFSGQTFVAYRQLRDLFAREQFDIVHTHTPVGGVLTRLAARDARRGGTRVIYTAHGFHFYDGAPAINWLLWYPVERSMSRFTDVLVTINREDFERAKRFARCRVEYVPGVGVDLSRFSHVKCPGATRRTLGLREENFAVLSVGDLIPRKNQSAIIEALPLLDPSVRLLVCGEGPERERLERLAGRLGVSDRVRLLGFRDDIADIMHACDCLVLPSVHEGLPVSVMEAMAAGLPVVASRIRGIDPDLLKDGTSGIVLDGLGPQEIAAAVERLRMDGSLRVRLVFGARESVQRFDLGDVLRATSRVYQGGGIPWLTRDEMGVPADADLVLSIGDLSRNKNHEVLVRALPLLPNSYHIAIAGEGPMREGLEKLAAKLSVGDRLHLLGFRSDVNSLLNAADVFCFPSIREGLPVSLIEAAATATPCVSSSARGCSEVLGEAGSFVDEPRSVTAWARAIEGPRQSAEILEEALLAVKKFSLPEVKRRYEHFYESVT